MIAPAYADDGALSKAAYNRLKSNYPLVAKYENGQYITRVFGQAFGTGSSPQDVAGRFKNEYASLFNADPEDLRPVSYLPDGRHTLPLMYNRETGDYKFTLVYYSQYRDNIPVFRSDLRLLVLNAPGYPLVMASSGLRDLGDFSAAGAVSGDRMLVENAVRSFHPGLININDPRVVIWAGIEDMVARPALAMEVIADNGKPAAIDYQKWLLVISARSGEILYAEDMVLNTDITGNVSGNATQGFAADICDEEVPTPLPYARVYVSGESPVFADSSGDFVIPHSGNTPVTVYSHIRGHWFRVFNQAGSSAELSMQVTPPGPANFLHNEANTSQYNRAEVNAYVHANVIRDFALTYNPVYPVIYQQQEFTVNVNLGDVCNAYYDGNSINFFASGGGCPNTAFSTVVHHEYGHHLVNVGGSGQDAYGEGMGDVVGMLITDNPGLAYGFFGDCNSPMRSGDNNFQYPCTGEIHYCGQLLSGSVWSTRNALLQNYPNTYLEIISGLAINAILLHRGGDINPSITIDYLTVDDDDGNIWNGTPHAAEIIQGFIIEHNMDFGVVPQIEHTPLIDNEDSTAVFGVDANVYSFFSMEGGSVTILYSYNGGGYSETSMVNTSGSAWHGEIPRPSYGTTIGYYIEAVDGSGFSNTSPENAPDSVYSFFFGADIIPPIFDLIDFPPNTVNLFGPYGPFIITAWDMHGIDESSVKMHYRINDETENELILAPTGNENEYALNSLDLDRQLNSGDVIHCYFTAYDQAHTPNLGRLPQSGNFNLAMVLSEVFEDFEEFGIDRWNVEGSWSWHEPGLNGGHSLAFGPNYPNNVDDMAYMDFGCDLSPYSEARISLYHRNAILGGDTCFVEASNNAGINWTQVGFITGYEGNSFNYDEYSISSLLSPESHDYRVGFRFVSDPNTSAGILNIDNIGWVVQNMTDVRETNVNLPNDLSLRQNYPNPFNPETNIYFELPSRSMVNLEIYDVLGRKIATLIEKEMNAGGYTIRWDGKDASGNAVSSGIYFYRLVTESGERQAKMTLLK